MRDFVEIEQLRSAFGALDIYVLDQLLKHNLNPKGKLLDAGCGYGKNAGYFLRGALDYYGVDRDAVAIAALRKEAETLSPRARDWEERLRIEAIEALSFSDAYFDGVFSIAVLHFAQDEQQFRQMLASLWRVLKPGGTLFLRMYTEALENPGVKITADLLKESSDQLGIQYYEEPQWSRQQNKPELVNVYGYKGSETG